MPNDMHPDERDRASATAQTSLDRPQREALRREIALYVGAWAGDDGELKASVLCGDRGRCTDALEKLHTAFAALDAIGWGESTDAPDLQTVDADLQVRTWAADQAQGLLSAFDEFTPEDVDLDAYRALTAIGSA